MTRLLRSVRGWRVPQALRIPTLRAPLPWTGAAQRHTQPLDLQGSLGAQPHGAHQLGQLDSTGPLGGRDSTGPVGRVHHTGPLGSVGRWRVEPDPAPAPAPEPQHAAEPPAPQVPPWRVALGLFTIIPAGVPDELDVGAAARAIYWLPAVGIGLAVLAAAVLLGAEGNGASTARCLLGAALAIGVLGVLTGFLHLDGLADTADGLGSRKPASEALAIMRASDIGPMGVVTLLLTVLVQVTALAALPHGLPAAEALVLAVATSRVAVVLGTGWPAARSGGFGSLVAGRTGTRGRVASVMALLLAAAVAGGLLGGLGMTVRWVIAAGAALGVAALLCRHAQRRLGGMTGDVFGAAVELATAALLVVLAVTS